MSADRRSPLDDEDLKEYIYGTINRLERLAKRLEAYAEEHPPNDQSPGPDSTV